MSFIRVSFTSSESEGVVDVVSCLLALGFPVRGKADRFFVLHDNGHVSQWATTKDAHHALQLPGSELLLWLLKEAAVAAVVVVDGSRVSCRLGLESAPREEQLEAAKAIDAILHRLNDVDVEASLD
ncbi:MAG: hypothetical protein Q8O67_18505 [Deltaproteobacteria bacterium]|nr:hypothetical protein [Deltaproteobacteria bacterium]